MQQLFFSKQTEWGSKFGLKNFKKSLTCYVPYSIHVDSVGINKKWFFAIRKVILSMFMVNFLNKSGLVIFDTLHKASSWHQIINFKDMNDVYFIVIIHV